MTSTEAEAIKGQLREWAESLQTDLPRTLDEMRASYAMLAELGTTPSRMTWTEVDAGDVPAIWADAEEGSTEHVLLYLHGGGYMIGAARHYKNFTGHLAKAIGCRVLNLDYRLAPEHPHPAQVEDAVQAFRWLEGEGFSADNIAIAGDSAGGGLTIATMLSLRDQGLSQPVAGVPISPWADMEALGASVQTNADKDVMVSNEMLNAMATTFLAGGDVKDPLAAPIYADYAGLAPLYIQVAGDEILLDDTSRVVAKAQESDADVRSEVFAEMQHIFQIAAGRMPEADDAVAKIASFLRPLLGLNTTRVNQELTSALHSQMPLSHSLGIDAVSGDTERVVTSTNWQAMFCGIGGVLHGGFLMALADGTGATLAFLNLPAGATTTTAESKTNFFRPVTAGSITATATMIHKGRTTMAVQTDITNDQGSLVSRTLQTQIVRQPTDRGLLNIADHIRATR